MPKNGKVKKEVDIRNIFSELPSDHLLGNLNFNICLAIVHRKAQTDEVGKNCCCAFRGADGGCVGWRGESAWERETIWIYQVNFGSRLSSSPFEKNL